MSNQKSQFPANMFPFFFPYPPPGFPSPFGLPSNKNQPMPMPSERFGYPMPHPAFINPSWLYPPPPLPSSFPYGDPRMTFRPQQHTEIPIRQDFVPQQPEPKKIVKEKAQLTENNVIVVEDNSGKEQPKRDIKTRERKEKKIYKKEDKEDSFQQKFKRTVRKSVPSSKTDVTSLKPQLKERKKEFKEPESKTKLSRQQEKEIKVMMQSMNEPHYENFSRSSRSKILSAKDGRGKIMIGDEFQAKVPDFQLQDEEYTFWTDAKKRDLLSRTFK